MRQLTESDLALKEDDEHLILEGRQVLRRVLNVARCQLEELHKQAQAKGEVLRITVERGALEKLLLDAAKAELGAAKKPKELTENVSNSDS